MTHTPRTSPNDETSHPAVPSTHPALDEAPQRPSRTTRVALILGAPLAAGAALLALAATGALDPDRLLIDPGVVATRGLPLARVLHDLAATLTMGLLLVALLLPRSNRPGDAVRETAIRWASWAAAAWVLSAAAVLVFTVANAIGAPVSSPTFPAQLWFYITQLELGQVLLLSLAAAAAVHVITLLTPDRAWSVAAFALALFALLPLALTGHAAGADEHINAVNSLAVHLIGVTLWAGGLLGVVLLARHLGAALPDVAERYSRVAGFAFAAVALSGIINASLRLSDPTDLATPYGTLLIIKTTALLALGAIGAWHRARVLPGLRVEDRRRRAFLRLAAVELVIMAATIGVSVALSLSETPIGDATVNDPRRNLLGYPYPDPVTVARLFTSWHLDWIGLAAAVSVAFWYLRTLTRLRRIGRTWPLRRTIAWCAGVLVLLWATNGGPGVYAQVHLSTLLGQHLLLAAVVPALLVAGRPVDLHRANRAAHLPPFALPRASRRSGVLVQVLRRPSVAVVLFFANLTAYYGTDWLQWSLFFYQGRAAIIATSITTGLLLAAALSRRPGRTSDAIEQLLALLATVAGFLLLGWTLRDTDSILAPSWWIAMLYPDDAVLFDQGRAGAVALIAATVTALTTSALLNLARRPRRTTEASA